MTKPRSFFVVSALALGLAWIPALLLTGFAYDQPSVSDQVAIAREVMRRSLDLFPVVWIAGIVFLFVELRSRKTQVGLTIAGITAFLLAIAHLTAWAVIF